VRQSGFRIAYTGSRLEVAGVLMTARLPWFRRRPSAWLIAALLILTVLIGLSGFVTGSEGVSGKVVNAATGKPIEGVAVVAKWDLLGMESATVDVIAIAESVTDANGSFEIHGWGPRLNKRFWYAGMAYNAPELIVFKAGYDPVLAWNYQAKSIGGLYRMTDTLDEKTIAISAQQGDPKVYLQSVNDIELRIYRLLATPDCRWKEFPALLAAMQSAGRMAEDSDLDGGPFSIRRIPKQSCGDPEQYFGE
jgi:hypothetical protein